MGLDSIVGDKGSGKNIISVWDCLNTPKEIPIFSNFDINIKRCDVIEPDEVFEVFEYDKLQPIKKLITDEAYTWFESRGSGTSDLNKFMSYLMFQSRKRGLNWISIAQLRNTLDLRWRGMEDRLIIAHERDLDIYGDSKDDFIYSVFKGLKKPYSFKIPYDKAKILFGVYDTKKVLLPPDFNEIKLKLKNKNPENLNKYIDKLANKIIELYPIPTRFLKDGSEKKIITSDWVRDKLLRPPISQGMEYTIYVKARIQEKT